MFYLNQECLRKMRLLIEEQLQKRGVNAMITCLEEKEDKGGHHNFIEFKTETFQTYPVICKSMHLESFGVMVKPDSECSDIIDIYISINTRLEDFRGGGNSMSFMEVSFISRPKDNLVQITTVL